VRAIVFSLFGKEDLYYAGALRNLELARRHYPGWTPWFYVGRSVPAPFREELLFRGAFLVDMSRQREDWSATMWRFYALGVKDLELAIFRDCDSRLNSREAAAVREWLDSDRMFHVMRDHEQHNAPILAGMWGARIPAMRTLRRLLPRPLPSSPSYHQHLDQRWLEESAYPIVRTSVLIHAEHQRYEGDECQPFPTPRSPGRFVGQGFTATDEPRIPEDVPE